MNAIEVARTQQALSARTGPPGGSLAQAVSRSFRRIVRMEPRPQRDQLWALRDVDLMVREGEALGIIGRNGAGKSTLLKISDAGSPSRPRAGGSQRGRIAVAARSGYGIPSRIDGTRKRLPERRDPRNDQKDDIAKRFDEIVAFAGVEHFIDTPVKRYSSGMYLRLAFSVAAHLEPDILIVDEVLAVGDAAFQTKCLRRMETAEREGRTVVFVSHNLGAITRLCNRVIWMENGAIRAEGAASEITESYLAGQISGSAERTLSNHAPDDGVVLRSVRVLNESGRPADILRRDRPLTIEVRFSIRAAIPGLDLSAWVVNSQGSEILCEAWSDTAAERDCERGEYVAALRVPPLLNVGDVCGVCGWAPLYETLLIEQSAWRFRVEGEAMGRPKRAVVLDLPWLVEKIGTSEDELQSVSKML